MVAKIFKATPVPEVQKLQMERKILIVICLAVFAMGCKKHSDDGPASVATATTNPQPTPNPCDRGGTIVINGNHNGASPNQTFTSSIANFMPSCGDTIAVSASAQGQNNWFPIAQAPTVQPNWYTIGVGSVTIHNGASAFQDFEWSATEKS